MLEIRTGWCLFSLHCATVTEESREMEPPAVIFADNGGFNYLPVVEKGKRQRQRVVSRQYAWLCDALLETPTRRYEGAVDCLFLWDSHFVSQGRRTCSS
ncbi:unnamed protein product [Lasius platythorax]|uniref:Uncharacterized protein n=1 Tax=Lasius platythorax TaxID=488582 RepID=A0AAV2NWH6_9HYME